MNNLWIFEFVELLYLLVNRFFSVEIFKMCVVVILWNMYIKNCLTISLRKHSQTFLYFCVFRKKQFTNIFFTCMLLYMAKFSKMKICFCNDMTFENFTCNSSPKFRSSCYVCCPNLYFWAFCIPPDSISFFYSSSVSYTLFTFWLRQTFILKMYFLSTHKK